MLLLPVLFAFGILTSANAIPLASGISFGDSDSFILMPGLSLRRVFQENPVTVVRPTAPPLIFGNEGPHHDPVPITFGNRKIVMPGTKDVNKQRFPDANTNRVDLFPSGKPNLFQLPTVSAKLNISSVENATSTANRTVVANTTITANNKSVVDVAVNNAPAVPSITGPNLALTNSTTGIKPIKPAPLPATFNDNTDNSSSFLFPGTIKVNQNTTGRPPVSNNTILDKKPECELSAGTVEFNGTCTRFLARNGCPVGQWFVKNGDQLGGGCVSRPCPIGQLLFSGKCISASDETACKDGQMLYVDFSGNVHCDCQPNFIYDPWSGNCFAQGDQGYCNFGEQLVTGEEGAVKCERNPCIMNGFVYHNATGWCYRKRYRGFCDDAVLIVHKNNRTAECSAIAAHSIFDLPTMRSCDGGTVRDFAGVCREEFRVPVVSTFPVMYGDCPFGFIKDAQGNCRKTHKLFG